MDKPRILVVEDNPVEQKLISLLADRLGVEATIAATAYRALQLLSDGEGPYAAVLMNFMLPAMSGLECTEIIRQAEVRSSPRKRIPIIAVTAAVTDSTRETCMDAGMDDYLGKPYSLQDFESLIDRWVLGRVKATA
jgi:CheY-like chemotaxis protein